jgi:hypothetical protein
VNKDKKISLKEVSPKIKTSAIKKMVQEKKARVAMVVKPELSVKERLAMEKKLYAERLS